MSRYRIWIGFAVAAGWAGPLASTGQGKRRHCRRPRERVGPMLALLAVLAGTLTACSPGGAGAGPGLPVPGVPDYVTGVGGPLHPVSDLNLLQMVPPGGRAVTPAPLHGVSPAAPPAVPVASFRHLGGTLNVAFLCESTVPGKSTTVGNTWYNSFGPLHCDPGPDQQTLANSKCRLPGGTVGHCPGRTWFTFSVPNTAKALMPHFTVPAVGVAWTLFAWVQPARPPPGAGVTVARAGIASFSGWGMSFSYPRSWHSFVPPWQRGIDWPTALAFESTEPMRNSCPFRTGSYGVVSGGFPCGQAPVRTIRPGGTLVSWATTGAGINNISQAPGRPVTIAGHEARLLSGRAEASAQAVGMVGNAFRLIARPSCAMLGASWVIEATISIGPGNVDQMLACIRPPGTSRSIAQVLAVLASLRLPG